MIADLKTNWGGFRMGMVVEFNWFMVVANSSKILTEEKDVFYTIKSEKRIYPIGFQVPLIIKEQGCIGMIKILKTVIDEKETRIYFRQTESFDANSAVGAHYYERYLDFKNREKEINP